MTKPFKYSMWLLIAICFTVIHGRGNSQTVFKCKNDKGVLIYQDSPCTSGNGVATQIKVAPTNYTEADMERRRTAQDERTQRELAKGMQMETDRLAQEQGYQNADDRIRRLEAKERQAAERRANRTSCVTSGYATGGSYVGNTFCR
jgi:hypothetical protein